MTHPQILGDRAGRTYSAPRDRARLNRQAILVFNAMSSGDWMTLRQISDATGAPEASCSARLRGFRAVGYVVEREYVARGLWKYKLVLPKQLEMFR